MQILQGGFYSTIWGPVPNLMSVVSCHCGYSLLASYFHQVCLSWVNFLVLLVSGNYASSINFESITNFTLCVCDISPCWFGFCVDLFLQNPIFFSSCLFRFIFQIIQNGDSAACFSPTSDFIGQNIL